MTHISHFSGGIGSWAATKRVAAQHGTADLHLVFADTLIEDDDLYRFVIETVADIFGYKTNFRLELPDLIDDLPGRKVALANLRAEANSAYPNLHWIAEGRTPWEVFRDERYVGNSRIDPCSKILKRKFIDEYCRNAFNLYRTHYFGIDWTEEHRIVRLRERMGDEICEAPLCTPPLLSKKQLIALASEIGIKPPRLYALGFSHNNCFGGSERFITSDGLKTFSEKAGQDVVVLGTGGGWKKAHIESFGHQCTVDLTISRYGIQRKIRTTALHRWFKRCGRTKRKEVLTTELRPGDRLYSIYGKLLKNVRPSAFGIAQGIVFGDGTAVSGTWNNPAKVMLCGDKNRQLLKWFPNSPNKIVDGIGIEVRDLPRFWKQKPLISESQSFLYGWLAGYFAADGKVTSAAILSSSKRSNLEFVQDVCARISISTGEILNEMRTGYGVEETPLYSLSLALYSLREDFFLIEKHRKTFMQSSRKRPSEWEVVEVVDTGTSEEVFCAVVPDGHAFALERNIFTGNCGSFCVKSGQAQFALLLKTNPRLYLYHEGQEQAMMEFLGKTSCTILKCRRNMKEGDKPKPLSLRNFRLRLENNPDEFDKFEWGGCGCSM